VFKEAVSAIFFLYIIEICGKMRKAKLHSACKRRYSCALKVSLRFFSHSLIITYTLTIKIDTMNIRIQRPEPGVTIINLDGRFDADGSASIRTQFLGALESGDKFFIVEMSGVDMLASTGIRLLLAGAKQLGSAGGKMVVAAAQGQVEYPMTVSGVDTVIPLYRTVDKAMSAL
jgi:anti-sigma B factor antagonist